MTGRALETVDEEALHAVQSTVRRRGEEVVLAMSFDVGTAIDTALGTHAVDLMLGLLTMRGWRRRGQPLRVDAAEDVTERWWAGELGPAAVVLETPLAPHAGCEPDDVGHVIRLVSVAWCMEQQLRESERPIPDLMTALAMPGLCVASMHPEPWTGAVRETLDVEALRSQGVEVSGWAEHSDLYVRMHLGSGTVRPWALGERLCVFRTPGADPAHRRVYVALHDSEAEGSAERLRGLLRLMLTSDAER